MEDLGNIELTAYEMKVEPKTVNVNWSKLPQTKGFKYKPPKRRKVVLERQLLLLLMLMIKMV